MADKVVNFLMNILANVSPQVATPLPPCLSLFILYIPPSTYFRFSELPPLKKSSFTFMNFWRKNRRAKRKKKKSIFCKLNLEYFYTVISTMTKIFTSSWKNAGLGPKQKYLCQLPSNLSERNLFAVWEADNFFSQSERTSGGLTWFVFVCFLRTPPPRHPGKGTSWMPPEGTSK